MAIKGILFDKDDTIIDLETFWREPVRRLAVFLAQNCDQAENGRLIGALEAAAGFSGGKLIPESPVAAGTNWDVLSACAAVLRAAGVSVEEPLLEMGVHYLEYACTRYGQVLGKADFSVLLPALKQNGCYLGVATSDSYGPAMHCLKALQIDGYFDLVLAADRVERAKPAPDMARIFCETFGLAPREVCMVGDSGNDMRFAANSGLWGVLFAPCAPDRPPAGTDRVICDLRELTALCTGPDGLLQKAHKA